MAKDTVLQIRDDAGSLMQGDAFAKLFELFQFWWLT